ncbi:MAG: ThuA domain-containing protein [Bacteroidales bacterium]|nr:ThuA domain-containing protein [Bacteroidales bacterium]MCF8391792.1 ThuA domain-containing protein [Bacteroidales bacterium]
MRVLLVILSILLLNFCSSLHNPKKKVLVITGGHSFDTTDFFNFFMNLENYEVDSVSQPSANQLLGTVKGQSYDAYIFYDMWKKIEEEDKDAYLDLTEKGKGFLFLHHSIVSYQNWDEFQNIIGGRYVAKESTADTLLHSDFEHDIELNVEIIDPEHYITHGISSFIIHDEGYSNLTLTERIYPLLATVHPDCHSPIGWTNNYSNSRIVYLMFGHDKNAYANSDFRKLVYNSLEWITKEN